MKGNFYDYWWEDPQGGEDAMEIQHRQHWGKTLHYIKEKDLTDTKVLDFGCNQGGFLRFLYAQRPFKEAIGVDLATKSIEVAEKRKGDLPVHYKNTSRPDKLGVLFDIAFSISVLYLIEDLDEHAQIINRCLNMGGVYYTTYTDYNGNPNLPDMFKAINRGANLQMQLHSLDEIAKAFWKSGFRVELQRLRPQDYIQLNQNDSWHARIQEKMSYEYEQGYIFRMTKIQELDLN